MWIVFFPWRQSGFWTTFLRSARRSRSRSRGRSRGRGVPPPPRPRREELSRRPPQPPPPPPPRPGWQLSERHIRNHNIEIMISFAFFCIFLRVKIMMVLVNDSMSLSTHNLLKSSKVSKFLEVFPSNVLLFFLYKPCHVAVGPRRRGEHRPDRDRRDRHDERDRERHRERERERPALERQRNSNQLQTYLNFCTKIIRLSRWK